MVGKISVNNCSKNFYKTDKKFEKLCTRAIGAIETIGAIGPRRRKRYRIGVMDPGAHGNHAAQGFLLIDDARISVRSCCIMLNEIDRN